MTAVTVSVSLSRSVVLSRTGIVIAVFWYVIAGSATATGGASGTSYALAALYLKLYFLSVASCVASVSNFPAFWPKVRNVKASFAAIAFCGEALTEVPRE